MSLLVWLPLNGDLRNNGLAGGITVTNSGATVNAAGKIGKCYEFPKTADGKLTYPRVTSGNVAEFSVAGWINLNSGYGTNNGFHLINWGLSYGRICFSKDGRAVRVLMTDGDSGATAGYASVMTASQVSAGIWYHVAVCFDNGDLRIYINGELDNQVTTTISTVKVTAASVIIGLFGSEYGSGKLNDYRFYDHALSDREVKELAKGLVAHWKLDENINVLNNAYNYPTFDTSVAAGGWYHWGRSGHQGSYAQNTDKQYIYNKSQTYSHMISNGASASAGANYLVYQNPAFEGGYRSLQCICKEVNGAQIDESIFYPAWNARDGGVAPNKWTSITPLGDGFYLCKCEGIHQNGSNDLIGFDVTVGNTVYISEAYCEDDREVCSDIFWQDEIGTTHDSSGYCHDGTLSPTPPTFDSDSARYSGCMKFSSNYIHCGQSNLYPTDEISVCWWGYMDGWSSYGRAISCTESGGWNFEPSSGKIRFVVYKNGVGYGHVLSETTLSSMASGWHFFVGTFDGYVLKIYIDGEYENVSTDASPTVKAAIMYRANVPIYIGCEANGANPSSPYFNGKLSDIRIYATALSAEDIKELYNTSASIDDHHNVYARELVED